MSSKQEDQYRDYVQHYIPAVKRWRLDKLVDYDNQLDRDLRQLAKTITGWEVSLVAPLGITSTEVDDIKDGTSNVELRRVNLLKLWKRKSRFNATYGQLLRCCLQGMEITTATNLCEMLAARDTEDVDSLSSVSPATTAGAIRQGVHYPPPPTVSVPTSQVKKSGSIWDKDFSLRLLKLIRYVDQDGEHKELRVFGHLTSKWKSIAHYLGFEQSKIAGIESAGSSKLPENCLAEVIEHWQSNSIKMEGSYQETWRGLHKLLVDSENTKMAQNLEAALNAQCSSVKRNYTENGSHLPLPGVSAASNGHQHHTNESAIPNAASAMPHANNMAASKSPSGKRKKFNFEELANWLDTEGTSPQDIQLFKASEINERQFLKLDPHSLPDKLQGLSEATRNDLPDLQDALKELND